MQRPAKVVWLYRSLCCRYPPPPAEKKTRRPSSPAENPVKGHGTANWNWASRVFFACLFLSTKLRGGRFIARLFKFSGRGRIIASSTTVITRVFNDFCVCRVLPSCFSLSKFSDSAGTCLLSVGVSQSLTTRHAPVLMRASRPTSRVVKWIGYWVFTEFGFDRVPSFFSLSLGWVFFLPIFR